MKQLIILELHDKAKQYNEFKTKARKRHSKY